MRNNYTVICKRWFQKSYGNTYHSFEVFKNGQSIFKSQPLYGYGEQCLRSARDWITSKKILKDLEGPDWKFFKSKKITYQILDVTREKDL